MRVFRRPRSIRLRLAILLTALFVLLGATLLGVSYALVRSNLNVDPHRLAETAAARLGVELRPESGSEVGPADLHEAIERESGASGAARANPALQAAVEERQAIIEEIRDVQEELADEALRDLTLQYLGILASMALLSGALGWVVAGRVLRPMSEITETARRVSRESLDERIALEAPDDELKQLADTFDAMLDRLEAGFEREAAFVRNASHELRTPLSVIQAEADVTLSDEGHDPEALRRALAVVREAGERSERLIDALLTLERADRGDHRWIEVELSQLVQKLLDETDLHGLRDRISLQSAAVRGDRELLRTMVRNLIDNAARHNIPGGWIDIRTKSAEGKAQLEISNSGPRTSAEEAATLTQPFRRLGTARTGRGLGLGLSIAASVARAHGGQLAISPLEEGGLRVAVALPAVPANRDFAPRKPDPMPDPAT
jgi:signal transduction histidine kinase